MKKDYESQIKLSEIVGVPKKGIIFSDLDGVWFDEDTNFAPPQLRELDVVQEARDAGYLLVLVSDTGPSALARFAQELNFDPLIIGENGAVISLPTQGIAQYLTPLKPFFDKYKIDAIQALLANNPDSYIVVGDATAMVRPGGMGRLPAQKDVYLINTARECSFGAYTRVTDTDGRLTVRDSKTQATEELLKKLLKERQRTDLVCKRYDALGSCLVKDPTIKKSTAVKWVIEQFPATLAYYMIGDTSNDSMEPLNGRVIPCAVGNANDGFKKEVLATQGIVAPDSIANGANYIIREILRKG